MTFLVVLGGVGAAVASLIMIVVGVWACTAQPVKYEILTKKTAIIPDDPNKPRPPKEWKEQKPSSDGQNTDIEDQKYQRIVASFGDDPHE
jgi:hypothetical protein